MMVTRPQVKTLTGAGLADPAIKAVQDLQRGLSDAQAKLESVIAAQALAVHWEPYSDGPMFDADGIWLGPVLRSGRYLGSAGTLHWFEVPIPSAPGGGRVVVTDIAINSGGAAVYEGREVGSASGWGVCCQRAVTVMLSGQLQRLPAIPVVHLALAIRPGPEVAALSISSVDMRIG